MQFVFPCSGKRRTKSCNAEFTEDGIILAAAKAKKVKEALDIFSTASEFWEWYNKRILEINRVEKNLKTYKQIFQEIEKEYFDGFHRNTGRKRNRNNISDQNSFKRTKEHYFKKFPKHDNYPSWNDIQEVLFSWKKGTKSFKDAYYFLKDLAKRSKNNDLVKALNEINPKQTVFSNAQSCSWEDFHNWHLQRYSELGSLLPEVSERRRGWLWVASMCVMYGLRPSEVAALENLTKPWGKDGVTIPAINDPSNEDMLLVVGEFTYFGTSTKTGQRIARPMVTDKSLWDKLRLQDIRLPIYNPTSKKPEVVARGFSDRLTQALRRMKCPVTQAYAFRHLANQLGEKYGIPQEIRARILGHSVAVNESVYKKRKNLKTEIDLLLNHSRQPLDYEIAVGKIKSEGGNIASPDMRMALKTIYQI
ncbi:MAG: recombinase [Cyanobacteria bacterium P01_H01_bin.35]